ncbi:MAG: hypothetical protein AAFY11_05255 [Cyanobacteria bacterium J06641_5]
MTLDEQIATIVAEAPQDNRIRVAIAKAVAPVLQATIAGQLQHLEYQILLSGDRGDWLVTTLAHRQQPDREKRVVYAFATAADARAFYQQADSQAVIITMPVAQLLFRLLSLPIESLIFFDRSGNLQHGHEIERATLQAQIQQQLQALARGRTELA